MSGVDYRKPNRLKNYDYSQPGYYFVTICTFNKEFVFGRMAGESIILNKFGKIARDNWQAISNHFNDCEIDDFIIMPDHMHGIVFVYENNASVGHRHACALQKCSRKHERLPEIIAGYKSSVSKQIHHAGYPEFKWQRSYYDRVIRNEKELNEIRKYILNNPLKLTLNKIL